MTDTRITRADTAQRRTVTEHVNGFTKLKTRNQDLQFVSILNAETFQRVLAKTSNGHRSVQNTSLCTFCGHNDLFKVDGCTVVVVRKGRDRENCQHKRRYRSHEWACVEFLFF